MEDNHRSKRPWIGESYLANYPNPEEWCNGNTTGFGSVIPGSNPGSSTNQ